MHPDERPAVLVHERTERALMSDLGMSYDKAHEVANIVEYAFRTGQTPVTRLAFRYQEATGKQMCNNCRYFAQRIEQIGTCGVFKVLGEQIKDVARLNQDVGQHMWCLAWEARDKKESKADDQN